MDAWMGIVLAAAAVLVIACVAPALGCQLRRRRLMDTFALDDVRTVDDGGTRRRAEPQLADRVEQSKHIDVRPLSDAARARYGQEWTALEIRFVDRPQVAVVDADLLVTQVMRDCGYPVENFESQADLISIDHPDIVDRYRDAHKIYERQARGSASTEDLRRAVMSYRELFEELMHDGGAAAGGARR